MHYLKSNVNSDIFGRVIGSGGHGTVYSIKGNNKQVIKVSNKNNTCREWSDEYKKINDFMKRIENLPEYKALKFVDVVRPIDFISLEDDSHCYMSMPYIWRPDNNLELPTQQALLGNPSVQMTDKKRGEFIGLNQIKEILNNNNKQLKTSVFELGKLISLIHHKGKNDAWDLEVFIGRAGGEDPIKFWIADFDLSNDISDIDENDIINNDEIIERLYWSLDAIAYFPKDFVDLKLFKVFVKGYLSIIPDKPELVKKIFQNYM